jgi:hypothetical protein
MALLIFTCWRFKNFHDHHTVHDLRDYSVLGFRGQDCLKWLFPSHFQASQAEIREGSPAIGIQDPKWWKRVDIRERGYQQPSYMSIASLAPFQTLKCPNTNLLKLSIVTT